MTDVSIIIVNYNTLEMTSECIESIFKWTEGVNFEIILVDNNSNDGSKEYFSKDKRIVYIYSEENLGFGKGNNLGWKRATGKYSFFLNSDTLLLNNIIYNLYDFYENNFHLNIGHLGSIMVNEELKVCSSFGSFPQSIFSLILEKLKLRNSYTSNKIKELDNYNFTYVDYVTGADIFILNDIIKTSYCFDPKYFMYYEEMDWAKRLKSQGYNNIIINEKGIIHYGGGSYANSKLNINRYIQRCISLRLFIDSNYGKFTKCIKKLEMHMFMLIKFVFSFKNIEIKDKISILKFFYSN